MFSSKQHYSCDAVRFTRACSLSAQTHFDEVHPSRCPDFLSMATASNLRHFSEFVMASDDICLVGWFWWLVMWNARSKVRWPEITRYMAIEIGPVFKSMSDSWSKSALPQQKRVMAGRISEQITWHSNRTIRKARHTTNSSYKWW